MLMIAAVPAPAEEAPGASDETTAASALAAGETQEAVITADEENGLWEYRSETLTIRVTRYRETVKIKKKNKPREYCVAEIWASPESPLKEAVQSTGSTNYNYPYHGKAAAADATCSQVAKALGWDESVWDLSGNLPFFKGASAPVENPDVNPGGQLPDFDENEFYQ